MRTFTHKVKIGLHHTDAAGILFYSQVFTLAYEAFDAWLEHLGVGVAWIIHDSDFLFPYVHAEADYLSGMTVGQTATIDLSIEKIGASSLTVVYLFRVEERQTALVKTVHVAISKETQSKTDLPQSLTEALSRFNQS
jgi:1,4-dihydroxy-2-naphthoyl-CoA hydrolase